MKTFSGNFMGTTLRKASAFMLSLIMVFMPLSDYMSPLVVKAAETINIRTRNDGAPGYSGYEEGAYVEWQPVTGADGYIVYVSGDAGNSWIEIDDELIRYYQSNSERYYRADALGLAAGSYQLKVAAVTLNADKTVKETLAEWTDAVTVSAHDRTGYAWVNGKTTGAYNDDGTLREDAEVVYITNANKDTVTAIGQTGFGNIINSYKSAQTKSLAVRIIGNIDDPANLTQGDLAFENNKNGAYGITIEGVGEDAVANGWGIALKNASNVEIRNIAFMNCDSVEGDNVSLVSDNDHIWVHNCDMFYGEAGSDDDQKKGDGSLDCKKSSYVTFSYNHFWDSGKSCLLGMSAENNKDYFITYHHNWFDHSDSRHPRVRFYTAHVYNNYYDGNSKYGIGGALGGGSIFAEKNYFRNCKYPMIISLQGNDIYSGGNTANKSNGSLSEEDGSVIKAYENIMVGNYSFMPYGADEIIQKGNKVSKGDIDTTVEFDAYVAKERDEKVPEDVRTKDEQDLKNTTDENFKFDKGTGDNTYNNFDTAEDFYAYTADDAEKVPEIVKAHAGRINGGDLKWVFDNDTEDSNSSVITDLKAAVVGYKSDLVMVGGIEQTPMDTLYLVTFDPNNGESTYNVYVKEGDILTMPETPAMPEGKVSLDGWYNVNKKWNFENPVTAGMTLKAIWLAEGEESWDKIYPIGTERVTHVIATENGKGDLFSHYFDINGNLYDNGTSAAYEGQSYRGKPVRFSDSTVSINFTTLTKAKLVLQLSVGTKAGASLNIDGKKTTIVSGIIEVDLPAGEHTIKRASNTVDVFAITVIPTYDSYTVTFDTQGGTAVDPQTVAEGLKCTWPETQKEGYVVYAWYTDAECTKEYDFDTPVTGDITLYAKWAQKHTVTFDTQGGTAVDAQEVADGAVCTEPVTARTGYVFGGWYTDAQCKTAYDFSSPVTEDITLYAKWTALYTVTFDVKGGTPVDAQTVMSGTVCTEPVTEKEGYVFAGWYTDETFNNKYNFKTPVTSDMTLYARWRTQDEIDNESGMKVVLLGSEDGEYVYTGSPIKPEVRVTNNGEPLTEGKDYTVKYSNNTNVSTNAKPASLVVKGKGNLSGTSTPVNFTITKKNIGDVEYPKVMTVTANAKVAPLMMNGAKKLGAKDYKLIEGNGLTNGKYANPAVYNLKVQGQGNYDGTINITVMVVPKGTMQKFKVNVEGSVNLDLHDATKQTPEALVEQNIIKITDAKTGKPLTSEDYEIVCSSDTENAGTVKFTVIGKGVYGGSVAKSYNINPIKAQKASFDIPANVTAEFNAAGSVPKDFKIYYKDKIVSDGVTQEKTLELDQGVDYKIAYSSNKKAGKKIGKYTITFLGNFKGSETIKGVYDISPTELKLHGNTEIVIPDKIYKRAGSAYKSTPIVTVDGVTLKSSNYTVTSYSWKAETGDKYQDGNKVTLGEKDNYAEVKVTIVPKNGNYTVAAGDELTETYYVRKLPTGVEDLSRAKVVFKDKNGKELRNLKYNGKAYFTPERNNPADEVLVNAENAVYVEVSVKGVIVDRSLYTVKWTNSTMKGKAAVVISGTGETGANGKSAVGSKNASISIKAMDLKNTTFLKEFLSMLGM